jgi:2,3-bisphosphoglycerate-independent phosphoglycerate mutase
MVGHTGSLEATIIGVEAVDLALQRLLPVIDKSGSILVITADHGNADEMLEMNKKGKVAVRTAHSLNQVPFIIYNAEGVEMVEGEYGLSNVAATVAKLMGLEPNANWDKAMIK